jgi:hypothetical protein
LAKIIESGEKGIMAGHDVSGAFASAMHSQLLLSVEARGLNQPIVCIYRDMHNKLYSQTPEIVYSSGTKVSLSKKASI